MELKKLRQAILAAYPTHAKLKRMLDDEMGENLDVIAGGAGQPLDDVVYELVNVWARSKEKLEALIMAAFRDNPDSPQLQELYQNTLETKFVLNPATIKASVDFGPEIDWRGPTDELEFQAYLQPQVDYIDVGFMRQALEQTSAVCRVEIPQQKIQATGFLITPRLLLTNYHVLAPNLDANAPNVLLRFGYETGIESSSVELKLDTQKAILAYSEQYSLDYVLLQVEEKILNTKGIKPVQWDKKNLPIKGKGLTILQHPEGETMQLTWSNDGITGVYQDGRLQYINRASFGSSGSPCFDENWKVVALHHAQRSKIFGKIREGILMTSIYQEIQQLIE